MLTKQSIVELLQTNDKAIARALVALAARQTASERASERTINNNGEGFTPADAMMGTSMADFYSKRGYLSEKQLAYWKKPNVRGVWRICKYAGQLLEIAQQKAEVKKTRFVEVKKMDVDVGNALEEIMVLEEKLANEEFEFNMNLDSCDEQMMQQMELSMDIIRDRLDDLRKFVARAQMEG